MLKVQLELRNYATLDKAKKVSCFFKTGPGQYGEGDLFLGVKVPEVRKIALKYQNTKLAEIKNLLKSSYHEDRLLGLLILERKYLHAANFTEKTKLIQFYLAHKESINNWDLVDLSAYKILGAYCFYFDKSKILVQLSRSPRHWDRRIAMVSTYYFIKKMDFHLTLKFAQINLSETEDLMHKATGWMLREVGKKDINVLKLFIKDFGHQMPRTMLRYSIEKFSEKERKEILLKTRNKP
jgi:3-methyladenine DNA glycosylase AlkD